MKKLNEIAVNIKEDKNSIIDIQSCMNSVQDTAKDFGRDARTCEGQIEHVVDQGIRITQAVEEIATTTKEMEEMQEVFKHIYEVSATSSMAIGKLTNLDIMKK